MSARRKTKEQRRRADWNGAPPLRSTAITGGARQVEQLLARRGARRCRRRRRLSKSVAAGAESRLRRDAIERAYVDFEASGGVRVEREELPVRREPSAAPEELRTLQLDWLAIAVDFVRVDRQQDTSCRCAAQRAEHASVGGPVGDARRPGASLGIVCTAVPPCAEPSDGFAIDVAARCRVWRRTRFACRRATTPARLSRRLVRWSPPMAFPVAMSTVQTP